MEPVIPSFWQTAPSGIEWAALVLFLAWSLFGFVHFTYLKFKHGAEMPLDLQRYLAWRARARAARNGHGANPGATGAGDGDGEGRGRPGPPE